jgi:hypothetical protein
MRKPVKGEVEMREEDNRKKMTISGKREERSSSRGRPRVECDADATYFVIFFRAENGCV